MSASITIVSGSTMMPQPTSSGPALNQSRGKWYSPTPLPSMSNSTGQTMTNAATMASTERCLPWPGRYRRKSARNANAPKPNTGMSHACSTP